MKWVFTIRGIHTHVRVYMNGAHCGELCFRNEEFQQIQERLENLRPCVAFVDEELERDRADHRSSHPPFTD